MNLTPTRALAGPIRRLVAAAVVLAAGSAHALPVAPGWLASAFAQQVYGMEPKTLMVNLRADQIRRQSVTDLSGTPQQPTQPGSATASVGAGFGNAWAFGGEVVNAAGAREPTLKASADATYTGRPDADGHARAQGASGLMDTIVIQSSTLPLGAPVTIPFMLMMHGSLNPPGDDMGGPDGYFKKHDNTAAPSARAGLQLVQPNGTTALTADASLSLWDGYACGTRFHPEACSFVVPPDAVGAAENCFDSGCFTVGSQPSRLDLVFVVSLLDAHVGDSLDLYASAVALVDYTESARFGQVGADLGSTVHFGITALPAGVSVGSALGLDYRFDPVSYVRSIAGDGGGGGTVPEPTPALLVLLALAGLRRHARPRRA